MKPSMLKLLLPGDMDKRGSLPTGQAGIRQIKKSNYLRMKKRTGLIAVLLLLAGQMVSGQSLEDAKKDIYYEKFLTARQELQQIVSSKPEAEAYYYLGQADIGLEDYDAAKADFTKGLQVDAKSALNMVGMGQVAINEKNYDAALTQFKNAFAQSEGRDFNVVRAILAASSVSSDKDITSYAIDLVGQFKNNKKNRKYEMNAEDFTALGDANANMPNGGGNAASSYENAEALDSKYAASFFKEGILYSRAYQDSLAVQYWNDAINADANYAPAYYRLFAYYRFKDLDKSKQYLDKYVALSDDKYKNMEYESQMYYSQRNYPEAIRVADNILKTNPKPAVSTYKLLAISQNAIGDSLTAKKNMDTYFQKQDTDKIVPADYELFSAILSKLHQDSEANLYVAKAIAKDTTTNLLALRARADQLREDNNFKGASLYYKKILDLFKGNESNSVYDYYWYGMSQYYSHEYADAAGTFKAMAGKFPEKQNQEAAYYYWGLSLAASDSTLQGLAAEPFTKYLGVVDANDPKKKMQLQQCYTYLAAYYRSKGDNTNAALYADKLGAYDPTAAAQIYSNIAYNYSKAKDRDNALKFCQKSLSLNPNDSVAQQLVDYYKQVDAYNAKQKEYELKKKAYDKAVHGQ